MIRSAVPPRAQQSTFGDRQRVVMGGVHRVQRRAVTPQLHGRVVAKSVFELSWLPEHRQVDAVPQPPLRAQALEMVLYGGRFAATRNAEERDHGDVVYLVESDVARRAEMLPLLPERDVGQQGVARERVRADARAPEPAPVEMQISRHVDRYRPAWALRRLEPVTIRSGGDRIAPRERSDRLRASSQTNPRAAEDGGQASRAAAPRRRSR
jgi:hypothetical protein